MIQIGVVTLSAFATSYVNAFAHQKRLGWVGAGVLALLIMGFVEKFYFTLRHGLTTTYKSGRQRFIATLCYRTIQATMILNAAVLCAWVAGVAMPGFLTLWNHWSVAVHFALALLGVSAVRDADAVGEGFSIKFRWRGPNQQLLTFPRLTGEQFNTLKVSSLDQAHNILGEQITEHLRVLSLDLGKLDKAQFVARKLRINLEANQAAGAAAK